MKTAPTTQHPLGHPISLHLLVIWMLLWIAGPASAINIDIHLDTGDDDNPAWDPTGALRVSTFEAAAQIWENLLPGTGQHDLDVKWDDDFGALAQWNLDFEAFSHNNIRVNPANAWFFDPTPFDHSEYDFSTQIASGSPRTFFGGSWHFRDLTAAEQTGGFYGTPPGMLEVGYRGRAAAGSPLLGQFDLLRTVIHELGHELGVNSLNLGPGWDFEPNWVGGATGSGVRRSGGHLISQATLMCNACGLMGTRRLPSATDVLAAAEHHSHTTVNLARRDFISGTDWHVGTNWIGGSVPTAATDAFIRNPDVLLTVGLSATGRSKNLFIGERTWLSTNAHTLNVGSTSGGTITVDGDNSDTTLFVNAGGLVQTGNLVLQNQATLDMRGGNTILSDQSLNVVDSTSSIVGFGTITFFASANLVNDGLIEPRGDLTLSGVSSGTLDLDGINENGVLQVTQGNLIVNGPVRDAFDGTFSISGGRTATFSQGWELAGVGNVFSDTGEARINGDTVLSGTLTTHVDEVLNLSDQFTSTPTASMIVNAGGLNALHGPITYGGGLISGDGRVHQEGDATVTENTTIGVAIYDLDGQGSFLGSESTTTINDGKTLTINSNAINTFATAPGLFGGTLVLSGGSIQTTIGGGVVDFVLSDPTSVFEPAPVATLTLRDNGVTIFRYSGSRLVVAENAVVHAENNVTTAVSPKAEIWAATRFESGTVIIDSQMELHLDGNNEFSGNTQFVGADGELRLDGATFSTVTGTPTIEPLLRVTGLGGSPSVTRLSVVGGGTLRVIHQAEIVGAARLTVDDGIVHIGNLFTGADLLISDGGTAFGGHVQQTGGGRLVVSDLDFAASPAGFYVDALTPATVTIEGGGLLETTMTQLAPFASTPGSGFVTVTGAGSRWQNDGPMFLGGGPGGPGGDAELNITGGASVVTGTDPGSQVHVFAGDRLHVIGGSMTIGTGLEAPAKQLRINPGSELVSENGQIRVGGGLSSDGLMTVETGHSLLLDDGLLTTDILAVRGRLSGTGTIVADVTADASASVQPGLPVQDLVIDGSFATTGKTAIHIGGTDPSEFGQLFVNSSADITGSTLTVDLIDLGGGIYEPLAGDRFEILLTGGIIGDFATTLYPSLPDLSWAIINDSFSITLEVLELLAADFDGDGDVDGDDFLAWQSGFGTVSGAMREDGDADGDGDGDDFLLWQSQFGSAAGSGSHTVPEPATWVLLAICAAAILGRPKRQ